MANRQQHQGLDKPMAIYEMHIGSWRRVVGESNRSLSYRELAVELADYLQHLGYTHVEFLPVMDHPFFGSWGYQITGYFAPSANYGTPQDLMLLIDSLHQRGIGVILDWVPSHFPSDEHGLAYFDGTHLYEHADPRQGYHPEWHSYIFQLWPQRGAELSDQQRPVLARPVPRRRFARRRGGIDALPRLRAQSRANGFPTSTAARKTIEAVEFLRRMNAAVYEHHPER